MADKGEIPSNSELARQTGLSRPAVIKWVNPHMRFAVLDAETLLKWMDYFKVPMEQIIEIVPNDEDEDADDESDS